MTPAGDVPTDASLVLGPPRVRICDLVAAWTPPQRFSVDLVEEDLRAVAKAPGDSLGLRQAPRLRLAPIKVVGA